jgi:hypothetical protein
VLAADRSLPVDLRAPTYRDVSSHQHHHEHLSDTEWAICEAIWDRRIIRFTLHGHPRIAEPHDFGIIDGRRRLFFHQVGGTSRSRPMIGWRWADPPSMEALELTERRFPGPRPTLSKRHHRWERLIATVNQPPPSPRPHRR